MYSSGRYKERVLGLTRQVRGRRPKTLSAAHSLHGREFLVRHHHIILLFHCNDLTMNYPLAVWLTQNIDTKRRLVKAQKSVRIVKKIRTAPGIWRFVSLDRTGQRYVSGPMQA